MRLASLPRMADFVRFGEAGGRRLGWPEGTFLEAYLNNRRKAALSEFDEWHVGEPDPSQTRAYRTQDQVDIENLVAANSDKSRPGLDQSRMAEPCRSRRSTRAPLAGAGQRIQTGVLIGVRRKKSSSPHTHADRGRQLSRQFSVASEIL